MQTAYATSSQRAAATKQTAALALVAAGCVVVGWFVPFVSGAGPNSSLHDDGGTTAIAVLGPGLVGAVAAMIGLGGQRRAAALAAGAAAAVGTYCLNYVAVLYEFVSGSDGFFDIGYGLGFFLHLIGGAIAVFTVLRAVGFVRGAASDDSEIPPALAVGGALAITASAIGLLLPNDGISIFDVDSTPIQVAYIGFVGVVALGGIGGFMSRRVSGAALGVGSALTPLCLWLADAPDDDEFGTGLLAGLTDGNIVLVAGGAIIAVIVGVVALAQAASAPAGVDPFALPTRFDPFAVPTDDPGFPPAPAVGWGDSEVAPSGYLSAPSSQVVAAGWYPDPSGRNELRYWNGTAWTSHVANGAITGIDDL